MEENNAYLKFLITEDIYPVDEAPADEEVKPSVPLSQQEVETEITETKRVEEPAEEKYFAAPTKMLLVLYDYPPGAKLNEPLRRLMLNIIEAVKIDVREAVYVNVSHQPQPENLMDFKNIICFGQGLTLNLPEIDLNVKYQIQQDQQTRLLISASLQELDANIEEKKQLWASLQKMF